MGQNFYWVIGQGTDVGKTTLATALRRILNRRGTPALGVGGLSAPLPLAPSTEREQVAEEVIDGLLQAAKLAQ